MGCFARREATFRELKDRFQLGISEQECVMFVSNLISESVGRWTTEAYDNYQWFMNGKNFNTSYQLISQPLTNFLLTIHRHSVVT